jgi:hypothetical protein
MATASPPDPEDYRNPSTPLTGKIGSAGLAIPPGGSWVVFLCLGFVTGLSFGLFWSLFMALWMNKDFARILLGPGLFCGISFGSSMAIIMYFMMRPGAVSLPCEGGKAFQDRLDREMGKLRYRLFERSGDTSTFRPRTLYRPEAFNVVVRVGPDAATIVGPGANIKALAKRLRGTRG